MERLAFTDCAVRDPAGDPAIPPPPAESRLHRHYAGQEAGGGRRPAEGARDSGQEQQDGESVFRAAGTAPEIGLEKITRGAINAGCEGDHVGVRIAPSAEQKGGGGGLLSQFC